MRRARYFTTNEGTQKAQELFVYANNYGQVIASSRFNFEHFQEPPLLSRHGPKKTGILLKIDETEGGGLAGNMNLFSGVRILKKAGVQITITNLGIGDYQFFYTRNRGSATISTLSNLM